MPAPLPRFSPRALSFLRALARNNDREWFRARKETFETELKAPMVAMIEQLDRDFRAFAPALVASPRVSLFRIYRDTRFSEDKSPLKTHIGAVFPCRGLPKNQSPGLYVEVNAKHVLVAGGLYAPERGDLQAVRTHVAANLARFRSIVEAPGFRRVAGPLEGERLSRVPRGFAPDDPAADFLRHKQFLVWREFPAALATTPRFYRTVLSVCRAAAPLVLFLAEPLTERVPPTTAVPVARSRRVIATTRTRAAHRSRNLERRTRHSVEQELEPGTRDSEQTPLLVSRSPP